MRKPVLLAISILASTSPGLASSPVRWAAQADARTENRAAGPSTAASFQTVGLPDSARQAWEATVWLETQAWRGGVRVPRVETGSGVIVKREGRTIWIATSSHVVRCAATCRTRAYLTEPSSRHPISVFAELRWRDPERDLALLEAKVPRRTKVRAARCADDLKPSHSQAVLAIGFPDLALLEDRRKQAGEPTKHYSHGRLLDPMAGLSADYLFFGSTRSQGRLRFDVALIHDAALLPGSSGGPLIDSSGLVLGINVGSITSNDAESCAHRRQRCRRHLSVPIGDLLQALRNLEQITQSPSS